MKSSDIRKTFLEFFEIKQHKIVASAPIVVKDDPTLMFTNAGMNQFKDLFLGNAQVIYPRVADTQKCLRVSGKHNDLEEVGHDTYHHTMFEMLGNWSFGDYFKSEAIDWAWELFTEVYKIDKKHLYVTVFEGDKTDGLEADSEAYNLWKKHLPESQILYGSKKDNFWEMGDTGPCGPCSEIHADIRPEEEKKKLAGRELVNKDHPEVIELWNLVFIEFNRLSDGKLKNLAAKHVDTGMGFERLAMVLQGVRSNYDTDIFIPIIGAIAEMAKTEYRLNEDRDIAMRVIADHMRAVAFAIADGQLPSNTGAGYVIRRILRRAVRYGFTFLDFDQPFLFKLLPVLVDQMGDAFPEIRAQQQLVSQVIREEEASFLRTLSIGIRKFDQYLATNPENKIVRGDFAFELFDTFGFPIDLTQLMAREKGFQVDMDGYTNGLEAQKSRSREAAVVDAGDWIVIDEKIVSTKFLGYQSLETEAAVLKYRKVIAKKRTVYEIVLDQTPFYAESGGQVGDQGILICNDEVLNVVDTKKENNLTVHIATEAPKQPDKKYLAKVNEEKRRLTANNHTATHLMHAALRKVLGTHVEQKGSFVDAERFRFDFSHFAKMTEEEISEVERIVNNKIRENISSWVREDVNREEALSMGAMALFGEKYGDKVRVITFDPAYSIELCGGTHVSATGQIGVFKIISEGGIAAGVRRIEAVTAQKAIDFVDEQIHILKEIKVQFKNQPDVIFGVKSLLELNNKLQKEIETLNKEQAEQMAEIIFAQAEKIGDRYFIATKVEMDANQAKNLVSKLRTMTEDIIVIIATINDGKVNLALGISDKLVSAGKNAGSLIREIAKKVDGGGGGQPGLATAGGKNPSGIQAAFDEARNLVKTD